MKRHVTRGLVALGLVTLAATVSAQTVPDTVEVRNRKDGTTKTYSGQLKAGPAGFQVFSGEKLEKATEAFAPDDILKVAIGDLPGVERNAFNAAKTKEDKKTAKDYAEATEGYKALIKPGLAERSKRHLEFRIASVKQKLADDLEGDAWAKAVDAAILNWKEFCDLYWAAPGWELWPATRAMTRLQIERRKYSDAASAWSKLKGAADLPPEAKLEAALQEIDGRIRGKEYAVAAGAAEDLMKTATGARKERLAIYHLTAKEGGSGKYQEGIDKIKAEMDKSKDPSVHATGFAMTGELYLAAGKPRDAMWAYLFVETVVNQDKEEVFKAVSRLTEIFETQMDEEQTKKYREKIKRSRGTL
ncbi:hypothetical protein VT84_29660 [Gemmata sp. SH-PL17]|uniref:hypothetical protein n=1 Tax=Gemmata sp. SH-PL17 TaxID=1630693 RepID=UPI00078D13C5|nr:hypothetical protein [Gemmata sp. SH-PL17]AMV28608.1 hypothetical protein VT84_29660 [Gemmata sp. SH-PL17]